MSNSTTSGNLLRLQKVIADSGVTSRRKAEELILDGKVTVNGEIVTTLGTKVNPEIDTVAVNGTNIDMYNEKIYLILNKPRGYVTTLSDPEGRNTVKDLLIGIHTRVYPVGRLDYLSEGLLLLTNDGDMANKIMHPRYEVTKVYEVKVFGHVTEAMLQKMRKGVMTEDGLLRPKSVRLLEQLPNKTWIEFRLQEGKNREIRKICEAMDLTVDKLRRVAIEGLHIQGIAPGKYNYLTKKELLKYMGMNEDGEKKTIRPAFVSQKRTLPPHRAVKKVAKTARLADDKIFHNFRKDKYYETVQSIKELKAKQENEIANQERPNTRL